MLMKPLKELINDILNFFRKQRVRKYQEKSDND